MTHPDSTVVHAEIEVENCYCELSVNGIPVYTNAESLVRYRQSIQINTFVVPNLNVLELAVDIDPRGPRYRRQPREKKAPQGAHAVARLVRYPLTPGTFTRPEHGELLAETKWTAGEDPFATSPRELKILAELGDGYGPRLWQNGEQLTLDQSTMDEAIMVLEMIRSAMRRGDSATLLQMLDMRFRDVTASYQGRLDQAKARDMFVQWIARFGAEPDRVLPLDMNALDFRLGAERRVLLPHLNDFHSAFRVIVDRVDGNRNVIGQAIVPYDVRLGRIDGRLQVVA